MPIVLGEKTALWVDLHAHGDPGHGALPPKDQAALNLARAVTRVAGYSAPRVHPVMREQFRILAGEVRQPLATAFKVLSSVAGDAVVRAAKGALAGRTAIAALLSDTVSATKLSGGYKHNVVPGAADASLDCRLLPDTDVDEFLAAMRKRLSRLSVDVEEVARNSGPVSEAGELYPTLVSVSDQIEPEAIVVPSITAGITDIRFFRSRGATGYGWVPLMLTPEMLATIHGHDERVEVDALEKAAAAMSTVVRAAATDGRSEVRG
jgi:acetylornithine deacetylase/succinyl-diaminopimelate desuccinylase-like protein